jgi:outer membrane protein OmpA-like peptidoglycan-associated protein
MVLVLLPLVLGGCGGVSIILKSPLEDQCAKAGIQGCPEVVQGALVYIGGDKPNGKDQMMRGAAQNAPDKVKAFADAIRQLPLDKIPGAGRYGAIIIEVADILAGAQPVVAVVGPPGPPPAGPPRKIMLTGLPLDGAQLAGLPDIEFDNASASLKRSQQNDMVLGVLLRAGQTYVTITRLRVEGHTDSDGNEADNQRLSEGRALAVVDWLTTHGIARQRLNPVGCASRDPLFPNDSADHKQRNRRVEFDIETIEDQPVDGGTAPCAPNSFRHPH